MTATDVIPADPFAGCLTLAEGDARYKELVRAAMAAEDGWAFGKAHQALCHKHTAFTSVLVHGHTGTRRLRDDEDDDTAPEPKRRIAVPKGRPEQRAEYNLDGTITCAGPCGLPKPDKKFPTMKGGSARADVCRECRDAAIKERKAGGR